MICRIHRWDNCNDHVSNQSPRNEVGDPASNLPLRCISHHFITRRGGMQQMLYHDYTCTAATYWIFLHFPAMLGFFLDPSKLRKEQLNTRVAPVPHEPLQSSSHVRCSTKCVPWWWFCLHRCGPWCQCCDTSPRGCCLPCLSWQKRRIKRAGSW